jgi:hypothetical protein
MRATFLMRISSEILKSALVTATKTLQSIVNLESTRDYRQEKGRPRSRRHERN